MKRSLPYKKTLIEKALLYDQHTLEDEYSYLDELRCFQWDKIAKGLSRLDCFQNESSVWGVLKNRYNINGKPPVARNAIWDEDYEEMRDIYGIEDMQTIPLYTLNDNRIPERYARDGSLIKIISGNGYMITARVADIEGEWQIPSQYVSFLIIEETIPFKKVICIDRTNQNVTALERVDGQWLIRSMNPATTGIHKPPHRRITPLGFFVIQEKKERMLYLDDGTDKIGGFALYANRFSGGGYLHGVAVDVPQTEVLEFCPTLGTKPLSHMCIRNATSHAKFIYDWAPIGKALVYIIE